ncbi:hypothetical protein BT63DRAFT_115952 [Microthyrium microscopicum]|uniref:Uncharacterized protein n=1 Tax=Microthyrium microscopicum TaxID=703497 RepID=A0A6A6TVW6_9PEZI|nr:hypothetical protein BT63DRAFT_115952 [Microthyrium microscopicum]
MAILIPKWTWNWQYFPKQALNIQSGSGTDQHPCVQPNDTPSMVGLDCFDFLLIKDRHISNPTVRPLSCYQLRLEVGASISSAVEQMRTFGPRILLVGNCTISLDSVDSSHSIPIQNRVTMRLLVLRLAEPQRCGVPGLVVYFDDRLSRMGSDGVCRRAPNYSSLIVEPKFLCSWVVNYISGNCFAW